MARQLFRLGLDPASYNPVGLRAYSTEALEDEYKRIQKEARARLESLRKSKYGRVSEIYQRNKSRYPALSRIQDRRQLERAIQEGARFVQAEASTAGGQQAIAKRQLESLSASGYGWLKRPMLRAWGAYWEHLSSISGRDEFYRKPMEEEEDEEEGEERGEAVTTETQQKAFRVWAEENGYLRYEVVTWRGKERMREVWAK